MSKENAFTRRKKTQVKQEESISVQEEEEKVKGQLASSEKTAERIRTSPACHSHSLPTTTRQRKMATIRHKNRGLLAIETLNKIIHDKTRGL